VGFLRGALLVLLHCQVDEVRLFSAFVLGQEAQSLSNQLDVLLVAGDDERVQDLLALLLDRDVLLVLGVLGASQDPCVTDQQDEVDEPQREQLERHPQQNAETDGLVNDREQRGSQEHCYPADYVHGRQDKLVLIDAFEVANVH